MTAPLGDLDYLRNLPRFDAPALCAETDPEAFFPEKGGSTREPKKLCGSCLARRECAVWAVREEERHGVWGGLSEHQRRPLIRIRRRHAAEFDALTDAGVGAQEAARLVADRPRRRAA